MIIIVAGTIGRSVTGGQAWANLQYLAGLHALGHEVYYLEDVGDWSSTYCWEEGQQTDSIDYPANFIHDALVPFGLGSRWVYRVNKETRGLSLEQLGELCSSADLLLIRGVPFIVWRPEYDQPRRRAFIDVDPGFTQIRMSTGEPAFVETTSKCEHLCTIGQRIGLGDCPVPTLGREWIKTVSPVALEHWPLATAHDDGAFTTIVRWRGFKDVQFAGVEYGQRDKEFARFLDVPQRTPQRLKVALTGAAPERLSNFGWEVVEGWQASKSLGAYQRFIQHSRGEVCIAKHCYVATRGGWFSDRTACYLASGRPVVMQDTGLSDWIPLGKGLVPFTDADSLVQALELVNSSYEEHRRFARGLAERFFDSSKVLDSLLSIICE